MTTNPIITLVEDEETEVSNPMLLRYEQILFWGEKHWEAHYPDVPYLVLWAGEGPNSGLARKRVKAGRKLKGAARYVGYKTVRASVAPAIHHKYVPGRRVLLSSGTGAYIFTFAQGEKQFDTLYISAHPADKSWCTIEMVFVPADHLETWADFEEVCERASNILERSPKVYLIGGKEKDFKPKVEWENVILAETLKRDIRNDLEGFFKRGVAIYKELSLSPFRKLLFVGPPGTGKSTLCVALAKLALEMRCVVVYVATSDKRDPDETNFDKIQKAISAAGSARFPVLLVIEDLDAYLMEKDEKSQILNVLDGVESPDNPHGVLLVATTNYPEIIDERITKRPGRVDRIFYVPPIEDEDQALRMLKRYMGKQWQETHSSVTGNLVGQTGVFVREVAIYARMLAANENETQVSADMVMRSIQRLKMQLTTGSNLLPKRNVGFGSTEPYVVKPDFVATQRDK